MQRFFSDQKALEGHLSRLIELVCPRCGARGTFVRHGYIRGWVDLDRCGIRGWRIFCDPDSPRGRGCGHAPALRLSTTLARRCLSSAQLWAFLQAISSGASVRGAWRRCAIGPYARSAYRLRDRLQHCQSVLRTRLCSRGPPPKRVCAGAPLLHVLTHLRESFGSCSDPVSAYQQALGRDFLALA